MTIAVEELTYITLLIIKTTLIYPIYVICVCLRNSGVQHILYCVFLRLVYPMLPVSLNCQFFIASLVFSSVYFQNTSFGLNISSQYLKT